MVDPNSPSHQLVGAVLNGRWKLVRLIGEGGMGAVFEADSVRGEGKRAIKLLHPEFSKEEPILQRFFAEAQTSQSLVHQNIARVFESARAEDGTPYLVMELLQGMPLSSWIDAGTPIVPQQAAPIIYGVLQALHVAHGKRIIHRDLKPDNLFMTRDASGQYVVKVLDFGIAKVMDAAGGMGTKTRTGVLLGTPGYMSPEQIKNSKAVDPRSDLWAVGIIFYEMLTLRLPFDAENEFARLTAVLTDDIRPIESVSPQLGSWSQFFRRALAKEPADRFQTAEEMGNAVMSVSRGGTMSGGAPASTAAPAGAAAGKATVAMSAMPDMMSGGPPAHSPPTRPGSGTVPSSATPGTYQGAQQAAPPPAHGPSTMSGAAAGATTPIPPAMQAALSMQTPPPSAHAALAGAQTALSGAPSMQAPQPSMQAPQPHHTPAPRPASGSGTVPSAQYGVPQQGGDGRGPTHISAHRPPGVPMPSVPPPNVQVVEAPPLVRTAPVWVVGAVGAVCLLVGFLIGFLVGR